MPDLTTIQNFGTNVTVDNSTPGDAKLVIRLSDLSIAGDLPTNGIDDTSVITDINIDTYSNKVKAALILLWQKNNAALDNDETVSIYVSQTSTISTPQRNSIYQLRNRLNVDFYSNLSGAELDPDNIL